MAHPSTLRADVRGVTVVEFALIFPVLLMVICGMIEFGYVNLARTNLEAAVTDAARQTTVDLELDPKDREERMKTIIRDRMSPLVGTSGSNMTITSKAFADPAKSAAEDFEDVNRNGAYDRSTDTLPGEPFTDRNGNGQWDASVALDSALGGEGDMVRYQASYPTPLFFSRIIGLKSATINLQATAIGRNERKGQTK